MIVFHNSFEKVRVQGKLQYLSKKLLFTSRFQISPVILVEIGYLVVDIKWASNVLCEIELDLAKEIERTISATIT